LATRQRADIGQELDAGSFQLSARCLNVVDVQGQHRPFLQLEVTASRPADLQRLTGWKRVGDHSALVAPPQNAKTQDVAEELLGLLDVCRPQANPREPFDIHDALLILSWRDSQAHFTANGRI
jgi:hypothetical protein